MRSSIRTVDPATGAPLASYDEHGAEEREHLLAAADRAQRAWRETDFDERRAALHALAELLDARAEEYAELITREMGKPVAEARAEVAKCARTCRFYADEGERLLADEAVTTEALTSVIRYEALGVVLAVMPWNYPFWQVVRFAAPALLAGNGAILKHAPNVSGSALALEQLFADAGFPSGLFGTVLAGEAATPAVVGELIADPRISAITLTGSERAGAAVAAAAGRVLKKCVLELGGSDPFVVLDDADIPSTVAAAVRSRYGNGGQSCIAAKRFIVSGPVFDAFVERFGEAVVKLKVGDPFDVDTDVGPMARADLREGLRQQVAELIVAGARAVVGGDISDMPGYFYAPTVLLAPDDGILPDLETFGPVAVVYRAEDDDDAVAIANRTGFGLGAGVWTGDVARGVAVGSRIESGALFVNGVVASDPRIPFGGIKRSGYGRELGILGIREFTNPRTVWVNPAT
ncbi:NAD-dependent succinate-semialdehyde dehydrogenase [Actinoplanes sp. NPDC051851]|uniref:NAD-dependent succinate-semialdehyde dehydrogenase n=1 Tax=Actinoplanes sp. NPDC051851 TaxID=3154753 RepID=UPI00341F8AAB